ncbi:thiol:disulfide interchange protein DsbD [Formivibrio citricus]|uniref:Thiol:disulfide interchange protein DsbD n=1 Tax=Formivibrio citricus TaxID=83765 RepID=A0A1I5D155_9NEIS|nr:protein-disulfide reductase DsbD [Formivibrio citricus]SFN92970.1 thiol:disulfide interchange protein DsbD [Formivibrio citricus]
MKYVAGIRRLGRIFGFTLAGLWLSLSAAASAQPTPLPPEQAFRARLVQTGERTLEARFEVAPGHYLYRDRFAFTPADQSLRLQIDRPPGQTKNDPSFGQVETYPHPVTILLTAKRPLPQELSIALQYQGCAEAGICYPAQTVSLRPGESTPAGRPVSLLDTLGPPPAGEMPPPPARHGWFAGSLPATLGIFFVAGLGLAFTACMYPLIPIVSGIVLRGAKHGQRRALGLTFVYVQGMALTYTAGGLLAAASGAFLAVTLQQPWVIAGFSLFFVAMALAMFGIFSLQLPNAWQSRINSWANRLPGGRFVSVFVMGTLSALIVGPCIAPPLAAALAYLGQSGDLLLGGSALYALALGMGTPLMIIGILGSAALPRLSHRRLHGIRIVFGMILLGMAAWIARPLWLHRSPVPGLDFRPVASSAELDRALQSARGKPVLLDFYADWCTSCLEFEKNTLTDPGIQKKLGGFVLLRADITANTPEHRALLRRFGLYGPPALRFFDRDGRPFGETVIGAPDVTEFGRLVEQAKFQTLR